MGRQGTFVVAIMSNMKKAQVSLEFMFAIGLIVFIFLLIFYFTFERRMEINQTEKILAANLK